MHDKVAGSSVVLPAYPWWSTEFFGTFEIGPVPAATGSPTWITLRIKTFRVMGPCTGGPLIWTRSHSLAAASAQPRLPFRHPTF